MSSVTESPIPHPEPPTTRSERLLAISPLRAILVLGAPATGVMVAGAASNVFHTYFVSRLGGDAIAAVSLVFPITLILLTVIGGGIGGGISAAIAERLGARRPDEATSVAEHAFVIAAVLGAALTVALLGFAPRLFAAVGGRGEVLRQATIFGRVLFGGLLVTFAVSTFDSVLRGEGNVRVPAIWGTVSLTLQIVLTPVFLFALDLGIAGAALATIVGQAVGALPRSRHIFGGRGLVRPRPFPRRISLRPVLAILRVGIPASLATLVNYTALMILTAIVARYGDAAIAGFGLGTRLDFLILTLAFGIGTAVLTLVGLASGAGDLARVRALVGAALVLVVGVLAAVAGALVWRPALWVGLFSEDPEILASGSAYLRALSPSYPFLGASMVLAFAFQGLGRALFPLVLITARMSLVVLGGVALAAAGAPLGRVFLLMAAANVAGTVVLSWRLDRLLRGRASW